MRKRSLSINLTGLLILAGCSATQKEYQISAEAHQLIKEELTPLYNRLREEELFNRLNLEEVISSYYPVADSNNDGIITYEEADAAMKDIRELTRK